MTSKRINRLLPVVRDLRRRGVKVIPHWLGIDEKGYIAKPDYSEKGNDPVPFNIARGFVRGLGLRSPQEWVLYLSGQLPEKRELPKGIPATPERIYKEEWDGWEDWLGIPVTVHTSEPND